MLPHTQTLSPHVRGRCCYSSDTAGCVCRLSVCLSVCRLPIAIEVRSSELLKTSSSCSLNPSLSQLGGESEGASDEAAGHYEYRRSPLDCFWEVHLDLLSIWAGSFCSIVTDSLLVWACLSLFGVSERKRWRFETHVIVIIHELSFLATAESSLHHHAGNKLRLRDCWKPSCGFVTNRLIVFRACARTVACRSKVPGCHLFHSELPRPSMVSS